MAVCSQCGRQNADDARFCSGCAAPLVAEPVAPRTVRKTVTVLFCDMVDSTPLGERLDPESLRRIQVRWHESMRMALERHGGTVEKFVGDAVMAVFSLPVAHVWRWLSSRPGGEILTRSARAVPTSVPTWAREYGS